MTPNNPQCGSEYNVARREAMDGANPDGRTGAQNPVDLAKRPGRIREVLDDVVEQRGREDFVAEG